MFNIANFINLPKMTDKYGKKGWGIKKDVHLDRHSWKCHQSYLTILQFYLNYNCPENVTNHHEQTWRINESNKVNNVCDTDDIALTKAEENTSKGPNIVEIQVHLIVLTMNKSYDNFLLDFILLDWGKDDYRSVEEEDGNWIVE